VNVVVCHAYEGEPNYNDEITSFRLSLDPDSFYDVRYLWAPPETAPSTAILYVVADPNGENDPNGTVDEFNEKNNRDFILVRRQWLD